MLDLNKPVQIRDGREARIYATDGAAPFSIHGARLTGEGWDSSTWTKEGKFNPGSSYADYLDLVNVPEE